MFPEAKPRGSLRVEGKQISLFPMGPVIKWLLHHCCPPAFAYYTIVCLSPEVGCKPSIRKGIFLITLERKTL